MALLRRVLYWQAALWTLSGLLYLAIPRWFLETLFGQPQVADLAFVRITGVLAVACSLMMVLVAQRLDDVWWWAWTFAITDAALATICALNALFGPVSGSATLLWWLLAAIHLLAGAAILLGMGQAGQERPVV